MVSNFWKRTLFGFLFVVATLTAVIWHYYLFLVLFFTYTVIAAYELNQLLPGMKVIWENIFACGLLFLIPALYLYGLIPVSGFLLLLIPVIFLLFRVLFLNGNKGYLLTNMGLTLIYPGMGFLATALLLFNPFMDFEYSHILLLAVLLMVWVNDTFAYLTGLLMGRTLLFPETSPRKTREGAVGGIVFTLILALVMAGNYGFMTTLQWLIFGFIVALAAITGDYIESAVKRRAGVKDSGGLIPGHGGVLDRMDSLLLAAPLSWIYVILIA
ncbi:MAG: phosphatidate cytidylyltransferase [Bacteroidales bacterium]